MPATHFSLTKIYVADAEALEKYYSVGLGLRRTAYLEIGVGEAAFKEIILSVENGSSTGAQLALIQYIERPAPPIGEAVIVFMVDHLETVLASLVAAGGIVRVPITAIPEHDLKLAFVADPEGHVVEIMQSTLESA